jgi:GNAT superfamily N-acetyltransferase
MTPELTITDAPDSAAQAAITSGLSRYNEAKAGFVDARPLAVIITDPASKATIGGLLGRTSFGLLFIDTFFLPEHLRGQGVGSKLMELAEVEAKRRGCAAAVLFTINFQAPGFYERCGYRALGEIQTHPSGISRFVMTKRLD